MRQFAFIIFTVFSLCLVTPVGAETSKPPGRLIQLKPLQPLRTPRTLVRQSKTRLPGGGVVIQQGWQWKDPRQLKPGQRRHDLGRVSVVRINTPLDDGSGTLVQQVVLIKPRSAGKSEADRAGAALGQFLALTRGSYVEPVERTKLIRDAMRGIAGGLDRHTNYFDPEQFERLQIHLRGKTVGIGVSLRDRKGVVTVEKTYKGPARRSGMRKGDRVIAVNGKPVETVVQAARLLGGEAGTKVKVQLERQGKTLEMQLDRQSVDFNPVRSRLTADGIGYVRLGQFDQGSADKVRNTLSRLERRNHGPLKGLVLDLRDNPGGSIREANSLLNTFISKGTLVSTRGRGGKTDKVYAADPAKTSHGALPLAVLINKGSASASELVSGALRHHRGATLIGEKSYGKGTVQNVVQLVDGSGVKMTTARYYLPDGVTPDKQGITPDVTTKQAKHRFRSENSSSRRMIVDYNYEQALSVLRDRPAPAAAGLPVVHRAQLPAVAAP